MRIAVDAMGGDHAPREIVAGCLAAASAYPDTQLLLVGDAPALTALLPRPAPANLAVVPADGVIEMHDDPARSIRQKPDSSLVRAMQLVAAGEADGYFSAGNTGAVTAAATLRLGRIPGVARPGIATLLPVRCGHTIVCDVGACVDSKAEWIVQFAIMASLYASEVEHLPQPRVGLLSIGEEASKGDKQTKQAHEMLLEAGLNFVGNVDGKDCFRHAADVIACDGFAGNLLLKVAEGAAEFFVDLTRDAFTSSLLAKLGALLVRPALRGMKRRIDYSEYGGAFLLGVKGLVVIGHGRSNAKAVQNALRRTREGIEQRLVARLSERFAAVAPAAAGA
ncbi:MAG: phosphate acyltransferase PlsX [Fimbriimonadaceae bacterium]|nr:phosphate acyltransferase PlsX [Fimbriimonadaceae bacterium]